MTHPTWEEWFAAPTLTGDFVRLENLHERHAQSLARHATKDTWTFMTRGEAVDNTAAAWREEIRGLGASPTRVNWAVVMTNGPLEGEVAGRISYSEVKYLDRWLEVGTMLTPPFQGGAANPEAKLLLLTRAFEVLKVNRVQFKTDTRNARSVTALRKLGAHEEGTLRAVQARLDGTVRDNVMFSIVAGEWPLVRERLEARLGSIRGRP